jgi:hypothetical protein
MSSITNIKQTEQQLLENKDIEIEMVRQDLITPKSSEESSEESKSTTSASGDDEEEGGSGSGSSDKDIV